MVRASVDGRLGRDRLTTMACDSKPSLIVTKTNSKGAHILACGMTRLVRRKLRP